MSLTITEVIIPKQDNENFDVNSAVLWFTETANIVCFFFSVYYSVLNISTFRFTSKDDVKPYDIYGVTIGEVEVDLLTGQHQVSNGTVR